MRSASPVLAKWVALMGSLGATTAMAAIGVNHGFSPSTVVAGQPSTLTINLINQNGTAATDASLTVPLAGLSMSSVVSGCGGSAVDDGSGNLVLTGGTIPAGPGGLCTITAQVTSPSAGTFTSVIPANSAASSHGSNTDASDVSLRVNSLAPIRGAKAFSPTTLRGGGTSTVTITLYNDNNVPLTGLALTDGLPALLRAASPLGAGGTCSGAVSANPANTEVSLAGGSIPANDSCTVTFNVTLVDATTVRTTGSATNTIGASQVTADFGATNIAPFSGAVNVRSGALIAKTFEQNPVAHGAANQSFLVRVTNLNDVPLTGITFTDTVPAGVSVTSVVDNSCSVSPTFTASSVTLTGAQLAANSNCVFRVRYTPQNAGGTYVEATNDAANFGGAPTFDGGVQSTVTGSSVVINPVGPGMGVRASKRLRNVGDTGAGTQALSAVRTRTVEMVLTLTNTHSNPAGIVSFRDDLDPMGPRFTVAGAATSTCSGFAYTGAVGASVFEVTGGTVPGNGNCQIVVPIKVEGDATIANQNVHRNRIGGAQPTDTNPLRYSYDGGATVHTWDSIDWAGINVTSALTVAKSFSPATISSGQTTSLLTLTLNRLANATSLTNIAFTDTYATTPFALDVQAVESNSCSGTVNHGTPGQITLSGGSITAPADGAANSCEIVLRVGAPAGASGTITNRLNAGSVTTAEGVVNSNTATANLTTSPASLQLSKGFVPMTLSGLGQTSVLALVISNTEGAPTQTGVEVTDDLPAGMVVAATPNASASPSCGSPTITAAAGASSVTVSSAAIAARAVCQVSVTVEGAAVGNLVNVIPAGALRSDAGLSNTGEATATVTVVGQADLAVHITNNRNGVTAGGTTTYELTASNPGGTEVAGATLVNTPPAGVTYASWTCTATGGAVCPSATGSGPISETVTLPPGGALHYTITAEIDAGATGPVINEASIAVPGTVQDTDLSNNVSSDTDPLVPAGDLAPVPMNTPLGLALMAAIVGLAAGWRRRRV